MFDAWGNEKSKPTAMGPHRLWSICSWKRSSHSPFLLVSSFLDKWKNQNRFDINESNANLQHLHFFRPRSVMLENELIHIIDNNDRFVVLIYYKFHWIHVEFDGRRTHAIGNDIMLRRSNFESVTEARLIEFHQILGTELNSLTGFCMVLKSTLSMADTEGMSLELRLFSVVSYCRVKTGVETNIEHPFGCLIQCLQRRNPKHLPSLWAI